MISTPEIVDSSAQKIAFVHVTAKHAEMMQVMRAGLEEIGAALKAQGVEPTGPWFTHHLRRPTGSFDFRICFPVAETVKATGRVEPGVRDAAKVARTVYSGNYSGLTGAWAQFVDWIEENDHPVREDFWEVYQVGPDKSGRPEDWRTELNRPLA